MLFSRQKKSNEPRIIIVPKDKMPQEDWMVLAGRKYSQYVPRHYGENMWLLYHILYNNISPNGYERFEESLKNHQQLFGKGIGSLVLSAGFKIFSPLPPNATKEEIKKAFQNRVMFYSNLHDVVNNPDFPEAERMIAESFLRLIDEVKNHDHVPDVIKKWRLHTQDGHPKWAQLLAINLKDLLPHPLDSDVYVRVGPGMVKDFQNALSAYGFLNFAIYRK